MFDPEGLSEANMPLKKVQFTMLLDFLVSPTVIRHPGNRACSPLIMPLVLSII